MRAFILRRVELIAHGLGDVVLIGSDHCAGTLRVKEFLNRNGHPYAYLDLDRDADVQAVLDQFRVSVEDVPVVVCRGEVVLRNPSNGQIAECLGFNDAIDQTALRDVVIVGAGPAGLAAAVYAASEGLDVLVLESAAPGGQAGSSSKIENYLGFPTGISGQELAGRAYPGAEIRGGDRDRRTRDPAQRRAQALHGETDLGAPVPARVVVIATGAEYRKPPLDKLPQFEGVGIYYGASFMEAQLCGGEEAIVVGGGNSAGQAAVFLAQTARRVHMLVRSPSLADSMSRYLIRRIEENPAISLRHRDGNCRAGRRQPSRTGALAGPAQRHHRDLRHPPRVSDDRRRPQHAMAGRLHRARCQGIRQDRPRSFRGRSGRGALAARPAAPSAGNEPARGIRGRRRALGKRQAGGLGGRRGIDFHRLRPSGAARVSRIGVATPVAYHNPALDGKMPTEPEHPATTNPAGAAGRLDRAVDDAVDHVLGPGDAPITLVEYGSYACPRCRAANERITEVRGQLGERLRYVFRHRPLIGSELARPAAELAESAANRGLFWDAHVQLMTRSNTLTADDLRAVAETLGLARLDAETLRQTGERARRRVEMDIDSAHASGVHLTPAFFINGRRYDGPWDESSFTDAMLGSLGHRVRSAALTFASWAPSAGVLLLLASLVAVALANSGWRTGFEAFWHTPLGIGFGASAFQMSLLHWVNDALLTVFFLVVGLEIKREFTIGHLASRRAAALPVAAAVGGMAAPALIYLVLIPHGPWSAGWGVPMATDTAFAVAIMAMMGARVPVDLRIFLTAAAIVDDIGAIVVVALFYSGTLHYAYLAAAAAIAALLALLNRSGIYRVSPYLLAGVALWACVHAGGLHATLAGIVLAALIPTRPPPDIKTLAMQADAILSSEAQHRAEHYRAGPSTPALVALDAIYARLESPADRLLRNAAPRSSYLVLPIFALANAGVAVGSGAFGHHGALVVAIVAGLAVGKPLGFLLASVLAVKLGLAHKPESYTWRQLAGAGALAGIGFTMSLFIAGQAFPAADDFAVAKIAVFAASLLSSALGIALLWRAQNADGRRPG